MQNPTDEYITVYVNAKDIEVRMKQKHLGN